MPLQNIPWSVLRDLPQGKILCSQLYACELPTEQTQQEICKHVNKGRIWFLWSICSTPFFFSGILCKHPHGRHNKWAICKDSYQDTQHQVFHMTPSRLFLCFHSHNRYATVWLLSRGPPASHRSLWWLSGGEIHSHIFLLCQYDECHIFVMHGPQHHGNSHLDGKYLKNKFRSELSAVNHEGQILSFFSIFVFLFFFFYIATDPSYSIFIS